MIRKCFLSALRAGINVLRKKPFYFGASIRLTSRCNLNCVYCAPDNIQGDIDVFELISFLEEFRKKGLKYIILSGGEPFLYKDLEILMKYLIEKNFYIVLNTNGQSIEKSEYKEFLVLFDEIVISIDGPRKINDTTRGKGSLEKILNTLDFLSANKKKIILSTVLTSLNSNKESLVFFKKLRKKYGLKLDFESVSENIVSNIDNVKKLNNKKKINRFIDLIKKFAKKRGWKEIDIDVLDYIKNPCPIRCESFNYVLYINNNGDIFPCIDKIGISDYKIGNIDTFRGKSYSSIYCKQCFCNTLIGINLFLKNKLRLKSLMKWI